MYTVIISPNADADLRALKKSEPQAYKKAVSLIKELAEHIKKPAGANHRFCSIGASCVWHYKVPYSEGIARWKAGKGQNS